ncbi:MAG: histidine phosphatase family protein [Phycisphaerales bacterium]
MARSTRFTFVFIRSCSTAWDSQDRLCGITDLPATDESLGELTAKIQSDHPLDSLRSDMCTVLCGPSDVSLQSAKLLLRGIDSSVKVCDGLHELSFGLWEGVARSDLEERFPKVYSQWLDHPGTISPPDGETLEVVQERVLYELSQTVGKLKTEHPVVGLVLRPFAWAVLKCWLDQRPLAQVWSYIDSQWGMESFSMDRAALDGLGTRLARTA